MIYEKKAEAKDTVPLKRIKKKGRPTSVRTAGCGPFEYSE
jgi:hypothetical protein